jgi:hypothetical protein
LAGNLDAEEDRSVIASKVLNGGPLLPLLLAGLHCMGMLFGRDLPALGLVRGGSAWCSGACRASN